MMGRACEDAVAIAEELLFTGMPCCSRRILRHATSACSRISSEGQAGCQQGSSGHDRADQGMLVAHRPPIASRPMSARHSHPEHSMELDTLQALYVERLRDLYSAEQQMLKAMPKIRKAVSSSELAQAFDTHRAQTETQLQRLEQIFEDLGLSPAGKHCKGMEGLLAEATELIAADADEEVLDAGLIGSAQAVEHYEIAGYGTARTYSELLGFDDHTVLLQQTLDEEEDTDRLLSEIAMSSVNIDAMDETAEDAAGVEREPATKNPAKERGSRHSRKH